MMERVRLSNKIYSLYLVIILVPIITVGVVYNNFSKFNFLVLLLTSALVVIIEFAFVRFINAFKALEFDENNLYIIESEDEIIIPYECIEVVKLTMIFNIKKNSAYKIWYLDHEIKKEIYFMPNMWSNNDLFKFQDLIKQKNPNIIIKNFSSSFDLDQ